VIGIVFRERGGKTGHPEAGILVRPVKADTDHDNDRGDDKDSPDAKNFRQLRTEMEFFEIFRLAFRHPQSIIRPNILYDKLEALIPLPFVSLDGVS